MKLDSSEHVVARLGSRFAQKVLCHLFGSVGIWVCVISIPSNGETLAQADPCSVQGLGVSCGAVAVHAAAQACGLNIPIAKVIEMLGGPRRAKHSLYELNKALHQLGINSQLVSVSSDNIYQQLKEGRYFLILAGKAPTAKTYHCLTALGAADGKVVLFDFLNLASEWPLESLKRLRLRGAIAIPRGHESHALARRQVLWPPFIEALQKWWARCILITSAAVCIGLTARQVAKGMR